MSVTVARLRMLSAIANGRVSYVWGAEKTTRRYPTSPLHERGGYVIGDQAATGAEANMLRILETLYWIERPESIPGATVRVRLTDQGRGTLTRHWPTWKPQVEQPTQGT